MKKIFLTVFNLINKLWSWVKPYLTPKMIPILLFVWVLSNGVWYVIAFLPIQFIPQWLVIFARGYLVFLWSPFAIEKPIIIAISLVIYRIIYKEKFGNEKNNQSTDL